MRLMGPGCEEVARRLASEDGTERTGLGVRLHLMMCRHCRRYRDQLRQIREAARAMFTNDRDAGVNKVRDRILPP